MRVAVVQMSIDPVSRANNLKSACALIEQTAEVDPSPEVICLPARCDGGLITDQCMIVSAAMTDTFAEVLAAKTRELGVSLVVGFSESEDDQLYDSAVWYDADGDMLVKHRKITLQSHELDILSRGQVVRVQPTIFGPVGVLVSEDACAGPVVSTLVEMGSSIIFVCSYFHDSASIRDLLCELARENGVWLVMANSVGPAGGDGHSKIIDPAGVVVCEADTTEQKVLCYTIDLENN